jgi:hypothetical protein
MRGILSLPGHCSWKVISAGSSVRWVNDARTGTSAPGTSGTPGESSSGRQAWWPAREAQAKAGAAGCWARRGPDGPITRQRQRPVVGQEQLKLGAYRGGTGTEYRPFQLSERGQAFFSRSVKHR